MGKFDLSKVLERVDLRKAKWLGVVLVVVVVICMGIRLVSDWSKTPPPTSSTHRLAAGGHMRHPLHFSTVRTEHWHGRRADTDHYPPHHLDFTSSGGPVEVCVVPNPHAPVRLNKATEDFAAGRVPEEVIGQASGDRGRIYLKDPWRRGNVASYAVFVRSATDTEVTLVVHYGR